MLEHLALSGAERGQLIADVSRGEGGKGVEDEAGQLRGDEGIAGGDLPKTQEHLRHQ